jgi:hypothetical protein
MSLQSSIALNIKQNQLHFVLKPLEEQPPILSLNIILKL